MPLTDEQRAVTVIYAAQNTTLGALADMPIAELGMWILRGMEKQPGNTWSSGDLAAHATGSLDHELLRRVFGPREASSIVSEAITEGLSWVISNGLVGPAATSSGSSAEWAITRAGKGVLKAGNAWHAQAVSRLHPHLHPGLDTSFSHYAQGNFQSAVFNAMLAVEVALRDAAGLGPDAYGRGLAQEALKVDGPFRFGTETKAEGDGLLMLFSGAISVFKNPTSHRTVEYEDPIEAADIIHLGDLLLRMIDREQRRRAAEVT